MSTDQELSADQQEALDKLVTAADTLEMYAQTAISECRSIVSSAGRLKYTWWMHGHVTPSWDGFAREIQYLSYNDIHRIIDSLRNINRSL